ncbi:MAG TPA: hypothetical protein VF008_05525 [Niastella sp.]
MKTVQCIVPVILLITLLVACKKDKGSNTPSDLEGDWEIAESTVSITPTVTYPSGNGSTLSFSNGRYSYAERGDVVKEGSFTTMEDSTVEQSVCMSNLADTFTRRVVFDNDYSATKVFFHIAGDKLYLISGCHAVDGGQKKVYRRLYIID